MTSYQNKSPGHTLLSENTEVQRNLHANTHTKKNMSEVLICEIYKFKYMLYNAENEKECTTDVLRLKM